MARSTSSPVAASGTAVDAVPGRSLALNLLISLRPGQWTKNLLVFAGLLFGRRLFDPAAVVDAVAAFAIFCALSGVVYLVNDIADRDSDRRHPLKARRPIASGALPVPTALGVGASCSAPAALAGGVRARPAVRRRSPPRISRCRSLYSGPLKHIVIIDVLTIAIGFVLRAVGRRGRGRRRDQPLAAGLHDPAGAVHRAGEAAARARAARRRRRRATGRFSASTAPYLLDQMIGVVTASTLISYIFYTISPETQAEVRHAWLGLTIPFPVVRDFPVPVSGAPARRRREPGRSAADRSPAARVRGAVGARRGADHLPAV